MTSDNYKAIEQRAFERYILELVRGIASEEERLWREAEGSEIYAKVRKVELACNYPETEVRLLVYSPADEREHWHSSPLWSNPLFFQEGGAIRRTPPQMARDIVMWARGG